MNIRTTLLALALAATPATALAATPESGSLPKPDGKLVQNWQGEAYGQPFKSFPQLQQEKCIAPFCDTFMLTVNETGALTIKLSAPTSAFYVDAEVILPDGSRDYVKGNGEERVAEFAYAEAQTGSYRIRIWPNALIGLYDGQYTGKATLTLPPVE